jgi:thymidine kinase
MLNVFENIKNSYKKSNIKIIENSNKYSINNNVKSLSKMCDDIYKYDENISQESVISIEDNIQDEKSYVEIHNSSSNIYNLPDEINNNILHPNGYLKIVVGCMFSGKTSYIIRECKKWKSIGKKVLMINYDMDERYSDKNEIVSHDKLSIKCMMLSKLDNNLDILVKNYDVIIINEGQFFEGLKENVKRWCDKLKKIVIVSGLDGDYMRNTFGDILNLIPLSDEIIKLKAYCSLCKNGTDAIFTWKLKDNNKEEIIDIGTDKYIPLCRYHYNKLNEK